MLVPLYGFLEGDTIGLLVLARHDMPIAEVAESLQQAAAVRVSRRGTTVVEHEGRRLAPDATVVGAGLMALDRIDVRWSDEDGV